MAQWLKNTIRIHGDMGSIPGLGTPHAVGQPKREKKCNRGVRVVVQWLTNPTRNHEVAGSVPALAQWVNDPALP